jgi:hypothetical protein
MPLSKISGFTICVKPLRIIVTKPLHLYRQGQIYSKVTVTPAKVPVTTALDSKIPRQAGISKGINGVRSYVPVTTDKWPQLPRSLARQDREKWETAVVPRNVQRNEYLAGICGSRRQRQLGFLRNSASNGVGGMVLQLLAKLHPHFLTRYLKLQRGGFK